MKLEEKRKLLTSDLMSRANYWIDLKVDYKGKAYTLFGYGAGRVSLLANPFMSHTESIAPLIEEVKPYLRKMSSMTEEEKRDLLVTLVGEDAVKYFQVLSDGSIVNTDAEYQDLHNFSMHFINFDVNNTTSYFNWLNAHHFDYRGLIEKELGIDCTGLNIYENENI